jgi:hypothetical protein
MCEETALLGDAGAIEEPDTGQPGGIKLSQEPRRLQVGAALHRNPPA